ncbi:hypothetical protein [Streptomyces longwoodensis]|uniref:hypothetical protein n=1 Tax=Streptomyces longwoodensis TaxID=68231 RepID=UPI00384C5BF1
MSSVSAGRLLRRGLCASAAGALVVTGLVTGLGGGVAVADEAQSDQLWIQAPYEQAVLVAPDGGTAPYRSLALGLYHDNGTFAVTDGRLTVDVSGLAGVAEVEWPAACTPDAAGTVAVCDTGDVPTRPGPQVELKLRGVPGATAGAQGTIEYAATATGGPDGTLTAPEGAAETFVTLGSGPDLGVPAPQDVTHAAPGTTLTAPFAVTNTGDETAHGFTVRMSTSYGLDLLTQFPQCTAKAPEGGWYMKEVDCTFDTDVAPGATVQLPGDVRLAVNEAALYDRFDIDVEPGGGATDLSGADNYRAWSIQADNTADFRVRGTEVRGAAGTTVDATFRFVNRGPAWVAHVFSGDAPALVDFTVPEGTTAVGVPDLCRPQSAGATRYTCYLPSAAYPGLKADYTFELRVDRVVPDATGTVVAHPERGASTPFAFDPKARNNTARVVVNPSA